MTAKPLRVAALTQVDGSICGYFIEGLIQNAVELAAIVVDAKPELVRDKVLHEERTGGRMPRIGYESFEALTVPIYFVRDHNSPTTISLLAKLRIDLAVNAGTPRI